MGIRHRSRSHRALTAALGLSLVGAGAVACAGAPSAGDPPIRTAPCASPGVSRTTVTAGLVYPDSGADASQFGLLRTGIDARFGAANAAGGINGRQVAYEWRDNTSDPKVALNVVEDLVENEQVFGILEASGPARSFGPFLAARGVPDVGQDATVPGGNVFGYSGYLGNIPALSTYGQFARARGGTRAVILRTTRIPASATVADRIAQSLTAGGVRVVGKLVASPDTDPAAIGRKIKQLGANTVVSVADVRTFARGLIAARADGADVKLAMSPIGYDPATLTTYGTKLAGTYFFVDYTPFEAPGAATKRFATAMATYAPQVQPVNQPVALAGWLTADLFLRGLSAAGACPTRASFIRALRGVTDYDADGLLAPVNLAAGPSGASRCVSFVRVDPSGQAFDPVPPLPVCGTVLAG